MADTPRAVRVAARRLAVDRATSEVVGALEERDVPVILLKGPSIADWLYDACCPREYMDTDLLVPPGRALEAQETLGQLGFIDAFAAAHHQGMAGAHCWIRGDTSVDLHVSLVGIGVDDEAAWKLLAADTGRFELAHRSVAVLGRVPRALHVALHAAQHGRHEAQPLEDLRRLLARLDKREWVAVRDLAKRLAAEPALAAGLRLVPSGAELADELGLTSELTVEAALRADSAALGAMTIERVARETSWWRRVAMLATELFPSKRFMLQWSRSASRGRGGLLLAYLSRLVWVARTAPGAVLAWRRARRRAT